MHKHALILMALAVPATAQAQSVETSITSTFNGSAFIGFTGPFPYTNDNRKLILDTTINGVPVLAETSAVLDTDGVSSFFFKHDSIVRGDALAFARTVLTIEVTNANEISDTLRFDSQIIPGHLAVRRPFFNGEGFASAFGQINFGVQLDGVDIYRLTQELGTLGPIELDPEFAALNDLRRYSEPANDVVAYDWWFTNINLELGVFAPGETKVLTYDLFTLVNASPVNADTDPFPLCPYAQLSFGDPRTRGTTMLVAEGSALTPGTDNIVLDGGCGDRLNQITRLAIDPAAFSFSIVRSGSPIPGQPLAPPPIDYGAAAVPAPPALALFGLGVLAAAVSRRRRG